MVQLCKAKNEIMKRRIDALVGVKGMLFGLDSDGRDFFYALQMLRKGVNFSHIWEAF